MRCWPAAADSIHEKAIYMDSAAFFLDLHEGQEHFVVSPLTWTSVSTEQMTESSHPSL